MGIVYLILAVVTYVVSKLLFKKAVHDVPVFFVAVVTQLIGGVFALGLYGLLGERTAVNWFVVLPLIAVNVVLWSILAIWNLVGIRATHVSIREVLTQSRTLFAVVLSALVLKESIAGTAWIGLALIVGGISVAAYRPSQSWKFSDNKGVWIVLSASLLSGVIALIDKQIAPLMDPNLYTAIVYTVPGVMILGFINKERIDESVAVLKDGARTGFVVAAGIINGLTFIFTLYAYRHFDLHIAYPIIQTASVLTVLAGIIFFKERERIGWKLLGLTLALIGSFIIKVW